MVTRVTFPGARWVVNSLWTWILWNLKNYLQYVRRILAHVNMLEYITTLMFGLTNITNKDNIITTFELLTYIFYTLEESRIPTNNQQHVLFRSIPQHW